MKNEEMTMLNEKIEQFYGKNPELATKFFEALINDEIDDAAKIIMETMDYFTAREWALLIHRINKVTDKFEDLYEEDEEFQKKNDEIFDELDKIEDEEMEES